MNVKERPQQAPPGSNRELCIDSRKPKRPLGSETYNEEAEEPEDPYGNEANDRSTSSQANKENGEDRQESRQEEEDSTLLSKSYIGRDELEPIRSMPEREFLKAIGNLASNVDWNV